MVRASDLMREEHRQMALSCDILHDQCLHPDLLRPAADPMAAIARFARPGVTISQRLVQRSQSACFSSVAASDDKGKTPKTHTGQSFESDDYRIVKFDGKSQQINSNFAVDLIAEVPPIAVKGRITFCDGGDGPLGHPRVFINLDQPGNHTCGYCGLRFFQDGIHDHSH